MVKSFLSESALFDFHLALGQFLNYRLALKMLEPDRLLYLAVPLSAYDSFFCRSLPQAAVAEYQLKLLVYDPINEVITMDRLTQYREAVRTLLTQYSQDKPANGEIEVQLLFDTERDHYQLVDLGWDEQRRIYNCVMHLDIQDGKVWIQRNQTDERIAEQLVALGVAQADIILGLQPPHLRQYTEYGVA